MRLLEELAHPKAAGGKAAGLHWLATHGYQTPPTRVLLDGEAPDVATLQATAYAVRSSANVEDGAEASFAGQFATLLDVAPADVLEAVRKVRASATADSAAVYAAHVGDRSAIEMSVLIQDMIDPVVSGVVFTRNPITGLNEAVLEAVEGRGDQLVGEGVTPQRWVRRWGDWIEQPETAVLPEPVARSIVEESQRIAEDYDAPADLEWVWDGHEVWWLQIRPITGIDDIGVYSNRISKEVMPGLIKPLVWSVNVPVVNRAWIQLFTEAIGPNDLEPHDLAKSFAYRSYFNMAAIGDIFELMGMPRDSLESLLGLPDGPDKPKFKPSATTMRKMPRLLLFALRKGRFGKDPDKLLGELDAEYRRFDRDLAGETDEQLLTSIDELMDLGTRAAYANIVVPLLANLYTGVLRKRLDKRGIDLAAVDFVEEADADVDPNPHLERLGQAVAEMGTEDPAVAGQLAEFIDRFGHFSDSGNDFSVAPWREHPQLVLDLAAARGKTAESVGPTSWTEVSKEAGFVSRALRRRAARYAVRRDQISSLYTYGYGLFRNYFLELGRRLVERGMLEKVDDVMHLTLDQVRAAIRSDLADTDARAIVDGHKAELERVADLVMPETIYGHDFIPAAATTPEGSLTGVATSRGHHRGPIRVVSGLADFSKVQEGDVLAIPFSDVGWTPLFAKAGAVIAESGGMLSHSSIVAREYGIPCVVSVPGATRLVDGTIVTVDGYRGEVVLG